MSRSKKHSLATRVSLSAFIASLAVILLLFAQITSTGAVYADEGDSVYDETGLAAWLGDHAGTGGTVTLGADIEITQSVHAGLNWSAPNGAKVRIETGDYGITVAGGGLLVIENNVHIAGGGAASPVIRVADGAGALFSSSKADATSIRAESEDGVALFLENGAAFHEEYSGAVSIYATGVRGIALYTEALLGIELYEYTVTGHRFEATGAGGRAIVSAVPVSLFLCRVTADAAAVEAPEITLDTCAVTPAVQGATVISRTLKLSPDSSHEVGITALGDRGSLNSLGISHRVNALLAADGKEYVEAAFNMSFDISRVDIDSPGTYPMPGNAPPPPYDLAENDFADIKIEVFDPAVPRFLGAVKSYMPPPLRYFLDYRYSGTLSDLVLWRSNDGGKTWYEYWRGADGYAASENVSVSQNDGLLSISVRSPAEELAGEIFLVFEALSLQTDSRTLYINLTDGDFDSGGIIGDRTGTDRISDGGDGRDDGNNAPGDTSGGTGGKDSGTPPIPPGGGAAGVIPGLIIPDGGAGSGGGAGGGGAGSGGAGGNAHLAPQGGASSGMSEGIRSGDGDYSLGGTLESGGAALANERNGGAANSPTDTQTNRASEAASLPLPLDTAGSASETEQGNLLESNISENESLTDGASGFVTEQASAAPEAAQAADPEIPRTVPIWAIIAVVAALVCAGGYCLIRFRRRERSAI